MLERNVTVHPQPSFLPISDHNIVSAPVKLLGHFSRSHRGIRRLGRAGIRRFRPRGGHQNIPFRGWDYMIPYMVGKLTPNLSHLTRGLVKYIPVRGYFRAVSSQNGDKYVTSPPPPPIVEVVHRLRVSAKPPVDRRRLGTDPQLRQEMATAVGRHLRANPPGESNVDGVEAAFAAAIMRTAELVIPPQERRRPRHVWSGDAQTEAELQTATGAMHAA